MTDQLCSLLKISQTLVAKKTNMSQTRTKNISTFLGLAVCGLAAVAIAVLLPSLINTNTNTTKISDMIAENHTSFSASTKNSTNHLTRNPASKNPASTFLTSLMVDWEKRSQANALRDCLRKCQSWTIDSAIDEIFGKHTQEFGDCEDWCVCTYMTEKTQDETTGCCDKVLEADLGGMGWSMKGCRWYEGEG